MDNHKKHVEQIIALPWERLSARDLQSLMHLSYFTAIEFAESLRITLNLFPDDNLILQMAEGELNTNNLSHDGYNKTADHYAFLEHFINRDGIPLEKPVAMAASDYLSFCRKQSDTFRAETIFSREEELSKIFQRITTAKDWKEKGLPAFRYYLDTHITIDSAEGGHHDLIKHRPVTQDISGFYQHRLEMYRSIPTLGKT